VRPPLRNVGWCIVVCPPEAVSAELQYEIESQNEGIKVSERSQQLGAPIREPEYRKRGASAAVQHFGNVTKLHLEHVMQEEGRAPCMKKKAATSSGVTKSSRIMCAPRVSEPVMR
jgi:hypothetical protein